MYSTSFSKFAGLYGILAGIVGLLYLVLVITTGNPTGVLPSLALLLVGVFGSATLVGLYRSLREVDEGFALWGLLLGIGAAGAAATHGATDLANGLVPPSTTAGGADPADPRGFLTFAVGGLAILVLSWLILRGGMLSRGVGYLGILSGVLLILLYLAYMLIVSARNPIVLGLVVASGIAQPVWYLWIGWQLWQAPAIAPAASTGAMRPAGKRR